MTLPILYSFRRCPYAMRARLALDSAGVPVELREVVLRDKPQAFLEASQSGTVPCLKQDGRVIDESLDIMLWALKTRDPEHWLGMPDEGRALIRENDASFKTALDRYKYASRHEGVDVQLEKRKASVFLFHLNDMLKDRDWLYADHATLADMAVLPFVRQFAHVDMRWFNDQRWRHVIRWLEAFKTSDRFTGIMTKYPQWNPGDAPTWFP